MGDDQFVLGSQGAQGVADVADPASAACDSTIAPR